MFIMLFEVRQEDEVGLYFCFACRVNLPTKKTNKDSLDSLSRINCLEWSLPYSKPLGRLPCCCTYYTLPLIADSDWWRALEKISRIHMTPQFHPPHPKPSTKQNRLQLPQSWGWGPSYFAQPPQPNNKLLQLLIYVTCSRLFVSHNPAGQLLSIYLKVFFLDNVFVPCMYNVGCYPFFDTPCMPIAFFLGFIISDPICN